MFERLRVDRLAADLLRGDNLTGAVAAARGRVEREWTMALQRAAAVGGVRDDVTYADLSVLILGTAGRMSELGIDDVRAWQRLAGFVLTAVRPSRP